MYSKYINKWNRKDVRLGWIVKWPGRTFWLQECDFGLLQILFLFYHISMVPLMIIKLLSHIQIFDCQTPCAKNHTLSLFQHENYIFQFRSYFKCGITYRLEGMKLLGSSNWMALKRLSFRFISSISCDFLKIWKLMFGMLFSKNCSWHWTFTLFFEIPIWLSEGGISLHKEGSQLFWRLCWPVQKLLNFFNLCFYEEDFGVKAEWHFFTKSYWKVPCDGLCSQ